MKITKNILNKISTPFTSRYDYKQEQTELQKKRLKVCETCVFNSDNVKRKSIYDNLFLFLNSVLNWAYSIPVTISAICTDCGCDLRFKSLQKEKENMCGLGKWDNIK